jgi:hypothetical protein
MASKVEPCTKIPPDKCKPLPLCPGCTILNKLTVPCQKHLFWCWAAVAVAIDRFYRDDASTLCQCQVASMQKNAGDCCKKPCDCNQPWSLKEALYSVKRLDQGPVLGTLSFEDLMARITAADPKPVCARVIRVGSPHFVVIKGFKETPQSLVIADPFEGESLVSYNEFTAVWIQYYLTDRKNHGNCI